MRTDDIIYLSTLQTKVGFFVNLLNQEVEADRDFITKVLGKEFDERVKRLMAFIEEPVLP